jgi:periplasmic protein TonB
MRFVKMLTAMMVSLIVNAVSLYLLVNINNADAAGKPEPEKPKKTIVINEPPPKKQPRPKIKPTRSVRASRPRSSSVPNLPSPVSIPGLKLTNVAMADFSGSVGGELEAISTDFIFREDAVDTPPRVLSRAMPSYPWWAEKSGTEGFVVFRLKLNALGKIEKLWVEQSTPTGAFEESAEKAIRQYRFAPAVFKGKPVPVICRQKIVFQLGG